MRMNSRYELPGEQEITHCKKPCPTQQPCLSCQAYWQKMREEGYWEDGRGWTNKALKEMQK